MSSDVATNSEDELAGIRVSFADLFKNGHEQVIGKGDDAMWEHVL